jgi:hypothetical protein
MHGAQPTCQQQLKKTKGSNSEAAEAMARRRLTAADGSL